MRRKKGTALLLTAILIAGLVLPFPEKAIQVQAEEALPTFIEVTGDGAEGENGYHSLSYHVDSIEDSTQEISACKGTGETLPTTYDSRTENWITSVKNQGSYGTCWAFAAINAAETDGVRDGRLERETADLSEAQLAYFFYHRIDDPLGGTTGDKNECGSSDGYLQAGGNNQLSSISLASWISPANESVMPYGSVSTYSETNVTEEMAYASSVAHLQNAYWISPKDRTEIKKMIQEYGAVATSYYSKSSYYQYKNSECYYYYPVDTTQNHAVSIVGWDDTIAKENFSVTVGETTYTPDSDGAWLIKNSYGTSFGNAGYFWLSYEDAGFNNGSNLVVVYDYEATDNYDNNYQYDGNASLGQLVYSGIQSCYNANVFTAKTSEALKAVGFFTAQPGMGYEIQIYRNPGADSPIGTAVFSEPVTGTADYAGYHTVVLPEKVELSEEEKFSIVIQFSSTNDNIVFMIEKNADYSWLKCTSSNEAGQGYYGLDGRYWYDCSTRYSGNIRIKAFTDNLQEIKSTAEGYSNTYDGKPHGINVNVTAPEGAKITYSTDGTSYSEENPQFTDAGTYTVFYRIEKEDCKTVEGKETINIEKKNITVTAQEQTLLWGTSADNSKYLLSEGSLVTGEAISEVVLTPSTENLTEDGTITVSSVKIVNANDKVVTGSYNISLGNGKLKVIHNTNLAPDRIEVVKTKTTYTAGDTLNVDDLTVTAYYADGYSEAVTGYTTNVNELDMSKAETKKLNISFTKNGQTVSKSIDIVVEKKVITGDANGDRAVTAEDALGILKAVVGITEDGFQEEAADVTKNGIVSAEDALLVLKYVVGILTEL